MTATNMEMNSNHRDFYLHAIHSALEKGMAAKEDRMLYSTDFDPFLPYVLHLDLIHIMLL